MKNYTIAIDGPAASGKSTTARLVAQKLGWMYVDTGAMYRAVTLATLRQKISIEDREAVSLVASHCKISFVKQEDGQRVFLNDQDVTEAIRASDVTASVSKVSSYAGVRAVLVDQQREYAKNGSLVMDGRDIGTVVFPNADVKIFLKATIEERARRRLEELNRAGVATTKETVEAQLAERDAFDAAREHSPLRKASDAVELDTTHLTIDDQVQFILELISARTGYQTYL